MSEVKFIISPIEQEEEIVGMTNKNIEFFKTSRLIFTLPKTTVKEEYDIKKYEAYKNWLEEGWAKREINFTEKLLFLFGKNLEFSIRISNYGPLGFYNANTNVITINLNTKLDVINTIKHEMVHITLEPFIGKYNIDFARKELIVDTILKALES